METLAVLADSGVLIMTEAEFHALVREHEAAAWERGYLHNAPAAYWSDTLNPFRQGE